MIVKYDKQADAIYLYLQKVKKGTVYKTVPINEDIMVDLNRHGKVVGVEILGASSHIPKKDIPRISFELPVHAEARRTS